MSTKHQGGIVVRDRLRLPRPGKEYETFTFDTKIFSFDDFGGEDLLELARRYAAAQAGVPSAADGTTSPPRPSSTASAGAGAGAGVDATTSAAAVGGLGLGLDSDTRPPVPVSPVASSRAVVSTDATHAPPRSTAPLNTCIPVTVHYYGEVDAKGVRQPEGVGTGQLPIGTYEGEWVLGLPHGYGVFTASSAARYEGEWRRGYRCGVGAMSYEDMSLYRGEWRDGKRHGYGLFVGADAKAVEGHWQDDVLVKRFREEGSSHEVEQAKLLASVREYEVCLKPMARAALPNPVLPKSLSVAAATRMASLRQCFHTARVDGQQARILAVLRAKGLDRDTVTPRTRAHMNELEFKLAFHQARERAAQRQTRDHIRFAHVYQIMAEFATKDLPYQQYHEEQAHNLEEALTKWREKLEIKQQQANKLASKLDRIQMRIRGNRYGPGGKYKYHNRPGWDIPLQPRLDKPPSRGAVQEGVRLPPPKMPFEAPLSTPRQRPPPSGTEHAEYGSVFDV